MNLVKKYLPIIGIIALLIVIYWGGFTLHQKAVMYTIQTNQIPKIEELQKQNIILLEEIKKLQVNVKELKEEVKNLEVQ